MCKACGYIKKQPFLATILFLGLLGSLVFLFPQPRPFARNFYEQQVLHRELRNPDTLENNLLECALISSGLILMIGFFFFFKPGRKLINKTELVGENSWKVDIHILKTFLTSEIFFVAFVVFTGMAVFLTALFRAANTGITYDEAFTYLTYVLPNIFDSFAKGQLLNNHLLNSFCIRVIMFLSQSKYNELLIRFPNLFFYCIYIIFSYLIAKQYKNKYFVFVLFISNYYLNEYFGLARGYGMACACMTGACYFFEKWKSIYINKKNDSMPFLLFLFFCSLGALSNSITLYTSLCFLMLVNFKYKKDVFALPNFPFFIIFFITALHTFMFSGGILPVYSTSSIYYSIMSIPNMFTDVTYLAFLIVMVFFLSFSWVMLKTKTKDDYCWVSVIFIIICIVSQIAFRRGYPATREMVPFYPIFVIVIANALKYFSNYKITKPILVACIVLLCFQFFIKINTKSTKDWNDNYSIRDNIYNYIGSHDVLNDNEEFMDFIKISYEQSSGNPVFTFYAEKTEYKKKNKIGE
jgi:hypothetical protein